MLGLLYSQSGQFRFWWCWLLFLIFFPYYWHFLESNRKNCMKAELKGKFVHIWYDVIWYLNIPYKFPSALRRYGNRFLDSLLCIQNHNFYRDICKGCYAPQMRQGLDKYSYRNRNCNQAQKVISGYRNPDSKFTDLRFRVTRIFNICKNALWHY